MHCDKVQLLIDGYLDGQLDLERNLEIEAHLGTCAACGPVRQNAVELRSAIKDEVPYFRAPRGLEKNVRAMIHKQAPTTSRAGALSWQWVGVAAAVVLLVFGGARLGTNWFGPSHEQLIAQEIVTSHIRSLMANHLSDVVSTDQHTVKPWFDGKLDFAPPVVNLEQAGFPLVGGRLDYADGRPVAALVYKQRLHYINLFVWPSTERQNERVVAEVRGGYNLLHWTQGGMTFWAVSDLATDELRTFVALLGKT
jgi:anti-sigma factor RsiW